MAKKSFEPRYMIATKAHHGLGDIGRPDGDICVVSSEDDRNFIGEWITGFGFFNVKFPKATTRELTAEEIERYHGQKISVGNKIRHIINTKGENFPPPETPKIIILPENRKSRLQVKFKEYTDRVKADKLLEEQWDVICKIAVLGRLLQDGQVDAQALSLEMAEKYKGDKLGQSFLDAFDNACGVINDYCQTDGKWISGGTGLPKVPKLQTS